MRTFEGFGYTWQLALTFYSVGRVKQLTSTDLLDEDSMQRFAADLGEHCNVIYALVLPQAEQRNITEQQWGEGFAECYESAMAAFAEELVDFFRRVSRPALATLANRMLTARPTLETQAAAKLDGPGLENLIQRETTKAMQEIDALLAGNSGDSADAGEE